MDDTQHQIAALRQELALFKDFCVELAKQNQAMKRQLKVDPIGWTGIGLT